MKATELIIHLQKAIELHGDKTVWVDCSKEGLSTKSGGVYIDVENDVIRIGDQDFERDVVDFVREEGYSGFKIIELR